MFRFQSFASSASTLEEKKQEDPIAAVDQHSFTSQDDILSTVQEENWYNQSLLVLVVGASGDLAKKKTYPALFDLWKASLLPPDTVVWGFARTKKTNDEFKAHLKPYLIKKGTAEDVDSFLRQCFYKSGNGYGDAAALYGTLKDSPSHNLLVYLAIPPHVFDQATLAVRQAVHKLESPFPGFLRVVLEKPFGRDSNSCRALLSILQEQKWTESELYRIDHYLGKEMVQNILTMRQHNPWLAPLWNSSMIESVHLVFKEDIGTEGRGGYFDPVGIHRDILQNHLLQVLTLIAMELPEKWSATATRNCKVDVLKSMPDILQEDCLFGQYNGYKDDPTIENRETTTPTYACMRCWVNTDRWRGVPFVLEAGKALDERTCEARLFFRGGAGGALVLRLQPTPCIFLTTRIKAPGFSQTSVNSQMSLDYGPQIRRIPEAYTRLLLDVLRGDQAHFVRDDELIESWRIFTPVLQQSESAQPASYQKGTEGPEQRADFLEGMGVAASWLPLHSAL